MRASRAHSTSPDTAAPAGPDLVLVPGRASHQVQFYESDEFLVSAVADFLAAGLTVGQSLVVIATEPHREAFTRRLESEGFDIGDMSSSGQLVFLDARETLRSFMVGSQPDPGRFRATVGSVLERSRGRGGAEAVLRLYGEMVDLLWRDGNSDGAIRLEALWNDLSNTYAFSLLCAYAMGNFYRATDGVAFQEICRQHTHVIPTEHFTQTDERARLIEVTLLQQRAHALEAEVEQRKKLERRLRETLAARSQVQDALAQSERELRELLAEREGLLAAEREARADAEAATRAKSQFLAVMSHELRTPLNAISGHVQLLEMEVHGAVNDAQRHALERIERSQRHLLRLINEVLNLTRIETGRLEYTLEPVTVQELVAELLPMVEHQLAAKSLVHAVRLPASPLVVLADREKLAQVLLNLLSNAAKFTTKGGWVTIDATTRASVPGQVFIRVSDTGIGVPRDKQEVIFEPFVQVHVGPTRPAEGAGLGLAISRELSRGMGGELRARSRGEKGSTFTITLPLAAGAAPVPDEA
ncbi:MAG TPA: ATP-binding protein [Gemmatimonadaceae bacterium]|nr:ATP-binding protein [Gemmatimonadaceae bacterium]